MNMVPVIPESAPFTAEQRAWLNGFLAGVLGRGAPGPSPAPATEAATPLLIGFGSQSGNAESLARRLAREAAGRGFAARAAGLDSLQPADLTAAGRVLIVTSTWGEGDMPDNAAAFWGRLNQNGSSPRLDGVRYGVLALGDRNYGDTFCLAGRRLDERLEQLGAQRAVARVDCDVDFEASASAWSAAAFSALMDGGGKVSAALPPPAAPEPEPPAEPGTRKNPLPAVLVESRRLNGDGSAKDTRHVVLRAPGLDYRTGDALGIFVRNCPDVVTEVLRGTGLDGATPVALPTGGTLPLREALTEHFEIRHLVGRAAPGGDAAAFVADLRRLQPRLYSIASSPAAHPGEVHLCVGVVRYESDGIAHKGVASTWLAERLPAGGEARVFAQRSDHFRLPEDPGRPIIMVGPGTGIAPFRAFLEERAAAAATGGAWLFFGDQHEATDFLYRDELEAHLAAGTLTRLSTAFSRDHAAKRYVQHLMLEQAGEFWQWLEAGAHFYVCGDASRMAKDVDAALHEIIRTAGGRSAEDAAAMVQELRRTRRYQRDVY